MSFENFFDRMGNIIRSYLNDKDVFKNEKHTESQETSDSFYNEAYEELDEFLRKNAQNTGFSDNSKSNSQESQHYNGTYRTTSQGYKNSQKEENYRYSGSYNSRSSQTQQQTKHEPRTRHAGNTTQRAKPQKPRFIPVPKELVKDFETLQVPSGSPLETCKAQYKKLLKIYHPDKNTESAQSIRVATLKTSQINDAYQRIEDWYKRVNA